MKKSPPLIKGSVDSLAIFGGAPAFADKLHVGRPNIGDRGRLMKRIGDLLEAHWLTNHGPYLQEFEDRVRAVVGARHCIATCNGTLALEIAVKATGLTGEVILPSFTFVGTAHVLEWHGIRPVFCDVDLRTHNLDPERVEAMITPQTSGIVAVHLWGRPADVEALTEIAHRHSLKLIFDAAHAFRCSSRGRMIGNFGDAEIFSFHATKIVNSFEGGAVVTNDDDLAAKVRLMQNFGFAGYDEVVSVGTNAKMSEAAAVMGLTSLESLEEFLSTNRRNYNSYAAALARAKGVRLVRYDDGELCNYQYIVLEVDEGSAGLSRDDIQQILWAENVLARRYFYPGCHRLEPYRTRYVEAGLRLSNTEALSSRVVCLPTGTSVSVTDVESICQMIRFAVEHAPEIKARLGGRSGRPPGPAIGPDDPAPAG